ncbi:uncharacterized protein LOC127750660 [Frankliniella occidentalis]|uniref:Uncharacterized protein LOC127750660 n=1 Tax=Frankliniella occidentalis TaxID=133901 RepID=A0A9C6X474_FRAOC|nr:uncharacterized protein LOC127750660 [Frankliniella occidentalis]
MDFLATSAEVLSSLLGAAGQLTLKEWLEKPETHRLRVKMASMSLDSIVVSPPSTFVWNVLLDVSHNLLITIDKAEYYFGQHEWLTQLKSPLPSTGNAQIVGPLIESIREQVYAGLVLSQRRTALDSTRLYAFPFCSVIHGSIAEDCDDGRSLEKLTQCVAMDYNRLLSNLQGDWLSGKSVDLACSTFDVESGVDAAFATWSNDDYGPLIADLLAGKSVVVHADVVDSLSGTFAVKFNVVSLKFWIGDGYKHEALAAALQDFKLQLTHTGVSYFMCGDQVSTFSHRVVTVESSFRQHDNGEPVLANDMYTTLREGAAVLSPYTTWIAKLQPMPRRGKPVDYSVLQRFAKEVNLSLVGYGSYLESSSSCGECRHSRSLTKQFSMPGRTQKNRRLNLPASSAAKSVARSCPWRPLA